MANPTQVGSFIPTTNIWDPSIIYSSNLDPKLQEILVRMYQNLNLMAIAINTKDTGYYVTSEFVNGQLWFPNPAYNSSTAVTATFRQVWREVINFGALPNAATKSVAHKIPINTGFTFTRIYAVASDTTGLTYIPIPFVDVTGTNPVQLDVDTTNVNITTITNLTNYNICYVVLEYIKS
jgi:hypothetical protein